MFPKTFSASMIFILYTNHRRKSIDIPEATLRGKEKYMSGGIALLYVVDHIVAWHGIASVAMSEPCAYIL